ncbi:synaptonemal complex central element protein 1 isoform X3 [Alligator sinensis]|uniref:Synaptonemal complex central element protein 1 isoform X3 n=1 Tax=Alligator sinensis TaxID=38654 RepID=A0A3Q0FL55_ALLSI|nr:synaptonemal complex central element protein 1 isoform X3 [Alligator sinensis]
MDIVREVGLDLEITFSPSPCLRQNQPCPNYPRHIIKPLCKTTVSLDTDLGPKAEELLLLVKQLQKAGDLEPRIEDLVSRINKLQQGELGCLTELGEARERSEDLWMELEELTKEQTNLEDIHWQKEEALRVVQVQCQEAESESHRDWKWGSLRVKHSCHAWCQDIQHGLLQEVQQRIQDLTMGIQEETLKQRKQRLEFEQQLDELMEKHKTLQEGHTMDKLAVEIQNMSDSWERLLREDELIQAKLMQLKQKLDVLAQAGAGRREERRFLKSPEASAALQLLQQENQGAHSQLEVATQRHCQGLQRCNRLKVELEGQGWRSSTSQLAPRDQKVAA